MRCSFLIEISTLSEMRILFRVRSWLVSTRALMGEALLSDSIDCSAVIMASIFFGFPAIF